MCNKLNVLDLHTKKRNKIDLQPQMRKRTKIRKQGHRQISGIARLNLRKINSWIDTIADVRDWQFNC